MTIPTLDEVNSKADSPSDLYAQVAMDQAKTDRRRALSAACSRRYRARRRAEWAVQKEALKVAAEEIRRLKALLARKGNN